MSGKIKNLGDYIVPLNMNRLRGRMLKAPATGKHKNEILFIYGHHASIERVFGFVEELQKYGTVTVPDLPGFGGMDSFYKIGQLPTIDNFADYLAAFIKLRYRRKRVVIVAMSFGFVVVTRMLQRYPELAKKIDVLVSMVGFSHHEDFVFKRPRMLAYRYGARLFAKRLPAMMFRGMLLRPTVLRAAYAHTYNAREKFRNLNKDERRQSMDFEITLWRINDIRTHMRVAAEFLRLDNCRQRIPLPLLHINVDADRYLKDAVVEQNLHRVFEKVKVYKVKTKGHMPSVVATAKEAKPYFPTGVRRALVRG